VYGSRWPAGHVAQPLTLFFLTERRDAEAFRAMLSSRFLVTIDTDEIHHESIFIFADAAGTRRRGISLQRAGCGRYGGNRPTCASGYECTC